MPMSNGQSVGDHIIEERMAEMKRAKTQKERDDILSRPRPRSATAPWPPKQ